MSEPRIPTPDDDRDVRELLRLAGKRRAVPVERAARVGAAARLAWRKELRGRSVRRRLWVAAGLAAAAALALAVAIRPMGDRGPGMPPADAAFLVDAVSGGVSVGARPIAVGDRIPLGSELSTAGIGRIALRSTSSGHSLRLDGSTHIRLLDARTVELDRGALYIDSGVSPAGRASVTVRTPLGLVEELGTQYEVRLEDDVLRLRLREGAVSVQRDGRSHVVAKGSELELAADGAATIRPIPTHGPQWDWIVGLAAMIDLEGRSAQEFLEWIARERGLRLVFADEAASRAAGEARLEGTTVGMTPDEALVAVLPACRLAHRVEQDALIVAQD